MSCYSGCAVRNSFNLYGRDATLRRTVRAGNYNPVTGTEGAGTVTNYSCKTVQVEPDKESFAGSSYEIGDQIVDVAADSLTVQPDVSTDKLLFSSDEWKILAVMTKYIGSSAVIYRLHLRQ